MSNPPKKSLPRPGRKPENTVPPSEERPDSGGGAKGPIATPSTAASSRQIALLAARAGLEKKATGIEIIDVIGKIDYADYLVLMTGASDRNVAAIAQEVDAELARSGFRSMAIEGLPAAQWVLIDFVDVVVHVFQRDVRSLYDLDGLWMDAARVPMEGAPVAEQMPLAALVEATAPARRARVTKTVRSVVGSKPRASAARKAPAKRTSKAPSKGASKAPSKGASKAPSKGASKAPSKGASKAPSKGASKASSKSGAGRTVRGASKATRKATRKTSRKSNG